MLNRQNPPTKSYAALQYNNVKVAAEFLLKRNLIKFVAQALQQQPFTEVLCQVVRVGLQEFGRHPSPASNSDTAMARV